MSDADRYRQNAAECDRLAQKATDDGARLAFRQMASEWRALAADAARREAPRQPPTNPKAPD
ncbi:MAG TPA: hypothetical protein VGL66_01570 [Caulobacteraceae bacterium]|jgi:hypothetical protein